MSEKTQTIETNLFDGGPAFPLPQDGIGDVSWTRQGGMSLRDWFAGMCAAGICANPNFDANEEDLAVLAVRHADALIGALKGKP